MIEIPDCAQPVVSIQIVSFGSRSWLERSLPQLVANTPPIYELTIVDNGSTDDTVEWLRSNVSGATVIPAGRNLGFGPAHNLAALRARGEYLCPFSNDGLVHKGWLEPLIAVLDDHAELAVAGPQLRYENGELQEAGVLIANDGESIQLGAHSSADDPEFNFMRLVPAVSGACFLIRRTSFEQVGGFDPLYFPAYKEDDDLMLAVEDSLGSSCVYVPASVVTHAVGVTTTSGEATALVRNHSKVLGGRWARRLSGQPSLDELCRGGGMMYAARDALCTERILIDARPAHPADALLAAIATGGDLTRRVTVLVATAHDRAQVLAVAPAGCEIVVTAESADAFNRSRGNQYDRRLALV